MIIFCPKRTRKYGLYGFSRNWIGSGLVQQSAVSAHDNGSCVDIMSQEIFVGFFDMCWTARQGRDSYCLLFQVFGTHPRKTSPKLTKVTDFFRSIPQAALCETAYIPSFHTIFANCSLVAAGSHRAHSNPTGKNSKRNQQKHRTVVQHMLALIVMLPLTVKMPR